MLGVYESAHGSFLLWSNRCSREARSSNSCSRQGPESLAVMWRAASTALQGIMGTGGERVGALGLKPALDGPSGRMKGIES